MSRIWTKLETRSLAILLLGGLLLGIPAAASAAGPRITVDYIDVSMTPDFKVYIDYLDAAGRPISKLDVQDLTLLLDGERYEDEKAIAQFKKSDEAVAFVILVNNYRGYSTVFEEQKKGLNEFIRGMRAKDRAAVLYYSDKVTPQGDFTSDKDELMQAVNSVPAPEKPQEVFIDAIIAALDRFPESDPTFPRRRGLVMLSDALDQGLADLSYLQNRIKKDLTPKAKALGVKFYGLGYSIESREGFKLMQFLAKNLDGSFDDVAESEINRIGDKFTQILNKVYGQYIISFNTDDLDSDVSHTLQVNINYKGTLVESAPEEFRPRPVEGTAWWVILLIILAILAGVGLVFLLIVFIVKRKRAAPEEEEPVERECPVCGESLAPEDRTCEACMKTPHKAELKKVGGEWDGFVYIISEEITTIGSREGDIVIQDPTVSGKHAGIKIDELKFELADFGSTNGTYVNGKRISKQFLKDGDVIKLGNVDLKFNLA